MEIIESSSKKKNTTTPEKYEDMVKKLRKEYERPVKGMFEFVDAGAGWFEFSYRFFKDPIWTIRIVHGEITELPMGVVKHINNTKRKTRKFPDHMPENHSGKGLPSSYEMTSRIRFIPMDVL